MATRQMAQVGTSTSNEAKDVPIRLIDSDVHPLFDITELVEYIPEPWRSQYFRRYPTEVDARPLHTYPPIPERVDATPSGGGVPGSDPSLMDRQLLQDLRVDFAILLVLHPRSRIANPSFDSALCAAQNAWQASTWLGTYNWHGRYKGSIRVCAHDPEGAVREIEKWAGHPHMVQVLIVPETSHSYGQPQFLPILRAAARNKLPIAIHIMKHAGMRVLTPVGFPSYWNEVFAGHPLLYMSHLASLVFSGTFEAVPDLKIVCVEGGFAWVAPFMWRLDKIWNALGREVPQVKKPPSEYIKAQVKFTTQPLEETRYKTKLHQMMQWMDADRLVMLATDYPHYDQDEPQWTLQRVPQDMRDRIGFENAAELYGLPRTRRRDALDAVP